MFPYVFNPPISYWSMNTAKIRFIGQRAGGLDQLKDRKIAHVYIDNDYGRDTISILDHRRRNTASRSSTWPCKPPGLDQKATWLRVKVSQPDWVILRSTGGAMTPTALKEAAQVGIPRDKIVGNRVHLLRTGHGASRGGGDWLHLRQLFGHGDPLPAHPGDTHYVYARGKGPGPEGDVGTVCWNLGVLDGVLTTEALRTAMRHFGHQPLTGAQVQWGLEHLTLTAASLKALGAEGLFPPITLSCRDHEGRGSVKFQQWDGKQWTVLTDWIAPDQALVRPLVEASAARYAQEKGITPRDLPVGAECSR